MRKLTYLFFALCALSATAQHVKFGLKAGVNFANYTNAEVNTSTLTSFHVGLLTEIKVFKNFAVQPELLYSTQGAKLDNLGNEIKDQLGYISIPALAKFNLNDQLSLELGPQVSFLLNQRSNVDLGDTNTFDFAVAGGLSYTFGKHFFIQGRYALGLTEPRRDATVKNSVLQASVGLLF